LLDAVVEVVEVRAEPREELLERTIVLGAHHLLLGLVDLGEEDSESLELRVSVEMRIGSEQGSLRLVVSAVIFLTD
jgi:hypothetical protein